MISLALRPAIFVCDIQTAFRPAIHAYPDVIATSRRVLAAASILKLPVFVTTQNKARLGDTVEELSEGISKAVVDADKMKFSMYVPEVAQALKQLGPGTPVAIVGIESHVCVLQTCLDLLKNGHPVYILADGVSSCHAPEKPIALRRMAGAGAVVTTSESFLYEVMGDAGVEGFKGVVGLVKKEREVSRKALETLASNL